MEHKVKEWQRMDMNASTRKKIGDLWAAEEYDELEQRLGQRLVFGTAGLRGKMDAGYSCINDLVIIQTSQGLAKYLIKVCPESRKNGIVIGYDCRHNSHRFALLCASVFVHVGLHVYLFGDISPTPFVPFAVVQLKASAGVMVTASHNPKDDNGYKVYWNNGAQIIPPHDSGIQHSIEENLEPWPGVWEYECVLQKPSVSDPLPDIQRMYYDTLSSSMLDREVNANSKIRFTVTAMHGVSHAYMVDAFSSCGFQPYVPVKEQMTPDPEFPTVKFPNPEEGKAALDLSFKTANENNSTVILANDPDADRMAVAEKRPSGEWKVFTGNETGALLGWWAWHRHKTLQPEIPVEDVYMIASTVSSKILQVIANKEGFHFIETLTGFKWMGNKAVELIAQGKTVLFAFEEAIGFMNGSEVLDKDGISAAMRLAEMSTFLNQNSKTLYDKLIEIYDMYGYHISRNSYYLCYEPPTILKMFDRIRNFSGIGLYPSSLKEGRYVITGIRDLTVGFDSSTSDNRAILPVSSDSQMITFTFSNGCILTVRTSGTEPKIKYYSEISTRPGDCNWKETEEELDDLVSSFIEELMQPGVNQLIIRPS